MKLDFVEGGVDSAENKTVFLSKKRFTRMIEDVVKEKRLTYIDAVVHLCEDNNIEFEDVKKYIDTSVKQKIEVEAMNLNFLDKTNSL